MTTQILYQSTPKSPLQQSTRSTRSNHHSNLLAQKEDTDRRCQLRFLNGRRNRDEIRRVEQANAKTGGEDVQRLPNVDRAPPPQQDEDITHDVNGCGDDGYDFVSFSPVIYMASETPEGWKIQVLAED